MRYLYHNLGSDHHRIPWARYVKTVLIAHAVVVPGWFLISYLVTGDWTHRWFEGVLGPTLAAMVALAWGY